MKNIQKKLLLPLAILIGLIPLVNPLNIFDELRLFAFDTLQQINPRKPLEEDPVVIIDIDDESLNNLGQWPWSRDLLSKISDEDRKGIIAEGTLQNFPIAAAVASLLGLNIITIVALSYFLISSILVGFYAVYKSRS